VDELERGRRLGEEILAEAQRKAARVISKARAETVTILDEAANSAAESRERALFEARKKANEEKRRILGGTDLEIRKDSLMRIQLYLDQLIPSALARVRSQSFAESRPWLEERLKEGLQIMGEDASVLSLSSEADAAELAGLVSSLGFGGQVERDQGLAEPEAVLRSEDGSLRFEVRIDQIVGQRQREIRQAALQPFWGGLS
jgi:vacuolar-type H+-ATPase subunit E/Vma4